MKNLIILTFILAGLNAFADAENLGEKIEPKEPSAQNKLSGLYVPVSDLCSDGSELPAGPVTKTMDFLSDSLVKISQFRVALNPHDGTLVPILLYYYIVEYSLDNDKLIYGNITEWEGLPKENQNSTQAYYDNEQVDKEVSVKSSFLTLSYAAHGRCQPPAYFQELYKKVDLVR